MSFRPIHYFMIAVFAVGPAHVYAGCPFAFLKSEWRNLRDVFSYWSPSIATVRRVRVEQLPGTEMVTYPVNREHPIAGLDPAVRMEEITAGKEIRDASGKLWRVTVPLDADGNIVASRAGVEKKFATRPVRLASHRYRIHLDDQAVEVSVPVGTPPAFLRELEYSLRRLPKALIDSLGHVRLNLQPYQYNAHLRETMKVFTKAGATAQFDDARKLGTVDFYPGAYRKRAELLELLRHEFGHLVAWNLFGQMEPNEEWQRAMAEDNARLREFVLPFSKYATNSPTEDFAEAVAFYLKYDGGASAPGSRVTYEKRFALLDRYFAANPIAKIAARQRLGEWAFKRSLAGLGLLFVGVMGGEAASNLTARPTPTPTPVPTGP